MNHNILQLNNKIIKCKLCPRLIKFRDKIVKNKRKQFINESYWGKPITGFGDTNAKILFVGEDFFGLVEKILQDVPSIEIVICMSGTNKNWPTYEEWRDKQSDSICDRKPQLKDVAIQMYTSGTTGNPKGVQLTHDNFYSSRNPEPQEGLEWSEWTEDEVQLVTAPTFHNGGAGSGFIGTLAGDILNINTGENISLTGGPYNVGDVFKAAGWRAPAKHVRGSIFDYKNDWFQWTGPNYLI